MGHHFVPQRYLRQFAISDEPEQIWMFDKKSQRMSKVAIAKIAQQPHFYNAQTEKQLNEAVERPANLIFDKLVAGHPIDSRERTCVAVYIATMHARVPKHRAEVTEIVPSVAEKILKELAGAISDWAQAGADRQAVERRLAEFETVSRDVRGNPVKGAIVDLIRSPWPSQRVVATIGAMCWRIGRTKNPLFFLASDNPVHFFRGLGIANARSELTFPISDKIALYASWRGEIASTLFFEAPAQLVKECNRRISHAAERFVFSPRRESWIEALANKPRPFFSEIRW